MDIAALLGGVGLFLLGMSMMTDGLKLAAGPVLRSILGRWTSSAGRGLAAGAFITAIVRSSSATTVAMLGFVNAGLLTPGRAVRVVFDAHVGTTTTDRLAGWLAGWLVAPPAISSAATS